MCNNKCLKIINTLHFFLYNLKVYETNFSIYESFLIIISKQKSPSLRLHKLRQILLSRILTNNKSLIYYTISAMSYGIQGTTKIPNLNIFQSFQSINHRFLRNAPWYVSNSPLYMDLNVPTISTLASHYYGKKI